MLFLLVGGVFSQSVTTLYLDGGQNVSFSNQVYTDSHVTGAIVTFNRNTFDGKWNGLTGSNWVADLNAEETHTFTITLNSGAPAGFHFYIASNRYDDFSNGNARKYVNETIPEGATSVSYSIDAKTYPDLLKPEGDNVGPYKWVYIVNEGTQGAQLNIASITRTITTASSVAAPTISPASGTYDGDLTVTITPGDGNDKVTYSVTGSNEDASHTNIDITAETTINLTGSSTITVTATGYDSEDNASSPVTNTYSIPSGQSSTTSGLPYTFDSWGKSITFNNSFFSNIKEGDYVVFDVANVAQNGTVLGFRKVDGNWYETPYSECTTTSGGNGAKGTLNKVDTQWWMKVNSDVVSALKNNEVRMQGGMIPKETAGTESDVTSSVTLNSLNVYKCEALNESSDNLISSKINHVVVELKRSFVANMWNTICLPFALTSDQATQLFGSGYQLAEFTDVSGTTMKFTTASSFVAGVPYLVKPTKDVSNASPVVLVDVNITAKTPQTVPHEGYSFVGNFTQKKFTGDNECNTSRFVATGNELQKPTNNSTLKSLRCYFTVPATPATPGTARSLSFDVDEEGNTTGVADINRETITNNGDFFNLAGQRVAQPTKGLYIVNGKKVVIK